MIPQKGLLVLLKTPPQQDCAISFRADLSGWASCSTAGGVHTFSTTVGVPAGVGCVVKHKPEVITGTGDAWGWSIRSTGEGGNLEHTRGDACRRHNVPQTVGYIVKRKPEVKTGMGDLSGWGISNKGGEGGHLEHNK
jgi:hypothetical protein